MGGRDRRIADSTLSSISERESMLWKVLRPKVIKNSWHPLWSLHIHVHTPHTYTTKANAHTCIPQVEDIEVVTLRHRDLPRTHGFPTECRKLHKHSNDVTREDGTVSSELRLPGNSVDVISSRAEKGCLAF